MAPGIYIYLFSVVIKIDVCVYVCMYQHNLSLQFHFALLVDCISVSCFI
jgi:hypothetical protein